jgi:hypothetical protein
MDHMFLVVPAADDEVIDQGKSCLAVPDGPVHVALERRPCISQAKGPPLVLEQAEGGDDGGLLHILWVDRVLMVPLSKVNIGEHHASGCLGGEVQHVWQQVDIRLCQEVEPLGISAGSPDPICLPHHVKCLDKEEVER